MYPHQTGHRAIPPRPQDLWVARFVHPHSEACSASREEATHERAGDAGQRAEGASRASGGEAPAACRAEELAGLCGVDWDWSVDGGECGGVVVSVFDQAIRGRSSITKSVIDTCLTSRTPERNWLTLAVSGRRPDKAFQFKQSRKRVAVTSTAGVRRIGSCGSSPRRGLQSLPGAPCDCSGAQGRLLVLWREAGTALRPSFFPDFPLAPRRLFSNRA